MLAPTGRRIVLFLGSDAISPVIITPAYNGEVTTSPFTVEWDYSGPTQEAYRLQIFGDELEATLLYDSQWQTSATKSHSVTGVLTSGLFYYVKVHVRHVENGSGTSPLSRFQLRLPSSITVTNLVASAHGGDCGRFADPFLLPGIRLRWDPIDIAGTLDEILLGMIFNDDPLNGSLDDILLGEPIAGNPSEDFVGLCIYRRKAGETEWCAIANLGYEIAYIDYCVEAYTRYEYAVVVKTETTAGTLYSARQSPPANANVEFDFIWLHEVGIPTNAARIFAQSGRTDSRIPITFDQTWGRAAPTGYPGEAFARTFILEQLAELRSHPREWKRFETLMQRQNVTSAVFCVRLGRDRESYFVQWPDTLRGLSQKSYLATVELREVHYDECVEC